MMSKDLILGIPKCCWECEFLEDWEYGSYGEVISSGYKCSKGIKFPVKKLSCKKQIKKSC